VYSRQVGDQLLDFGVSGKLVMNVLVMYDRQTESLWSQILGKAIEGEYRGTELEFLPSWQTTWEDWKTRHPETLALVKGYQGIRDPYQGYYQSGQAGVIGEATRDNRLEVKEFVIGVAQDLDAVAYPFRTLSAEPVVNDRIGNQEVLIVFDADNASGVVFNRMLNGAELTFRNSENLQLIDEETGSVWDGLSGTAVEGALAGAQLERIKSTRSFWFGWKDFYPDTRIYGVD
jgi:hypothetical protein